MLEFLSFILMNTLIASMPNYMLYFSCRRPGGCDSKHGPECLSLLTSVLDLPVLHFEIRNLTTICIIDSINSLDGDSTSRKAYIMHGFTRPLILNNLTTSSFGSFMTPLAVHVLKHRAGSSQLNLYAGSSWKPVPHTYFGVPWLWQCLWQILWM